MTGNNDSWTTFMLHFHKYVQLSLSRFLEAVLNLFRDRLRPLLKHLGLQDARLGLNMAGTYLLEMIILFLYKFKTASKFLLAYIKKFYEYCKQEISRKGGCVGINLTSFYLN